jgi:hypothetical protein
MQWIAMRARLLLILWGKAVSFLSSLCENRLEMANVDPIPGSGGYGGGWIDDAQYGCILFTLGAPTDAQ